MMIPLSLALCVSVGVIAFMVLISGSQGVKIPDQPDRPSDQANNTLLWEDITVPKAPYTPPTERVILRGPGAAFNRAMALYQQNDFAGAVEQLDPLSELDSDNAAEVKFYLGVSLLMIGRNQDAITPLRQAAQSSVDPRRESCHYYLALAYLKCDYRDQALDELNGVIEANGAHRSAARELQRQIFAHIK